MTRTTNLHKIDTDHLKILLKERPNTRALYGSMTPNEYVASRIKLLKGTRDNHGLVTIRRIGLSCDLRSEYIHQIISQNISESGRRNVGMHVASKLAAGTNNFISLEFSSPEAHKRIRKIKAA